MCVFWVPAAAAAAAEASAIASFWAGEAVTAAAAPTLFGIENGITLAAMEAAMKPIGAISSLAGSGLTAYSNMQAADANRMSAEYNAQIQRNNAQVAEWQAQDALARGEQAAEDHRRKVSALKGSQTASMAARGLDISEGTPLNILTDTDYLGAIDENTIKFNASREAWAHRAQGSNSMAQASLLDAQARNQNPLLAGASTLLTGVGSVADRWYRRGSRTITLE